MWPAQEIKNHINVLERLAIKLPMQTFSKTLNYKAIHLQVDNMVAFRYLLKMWGIQNLKLVQLAKEIWNHLLQCGITLTALLPSQKTERDSKLGVKKQFGLLRMEASSQVISENLSTEGNPRGRSICFKTYFSETTVIHKLFEHYGKSLISLFQHFFCYY